ARGPMGGARAWRLSFAGSLFSNLLHYRSDVHRVVRDATSGWDECSDPALLGMIATQNRLEAQITELMVDVDRWLCPLMDPAQRTFELKELIARYGWPDVHPEFFRTYEL